MSGPIVPPLQVTEVDGSPDGRPITKIIVSNGDLSISGRTATIDTTGSGGTPGGSSGEIQYNNAGAFGGAADFTFTGIGGADPKLSFTNAAGDVGSLTQKTLNFDGGTSLPTISTSASDQGLILLTGADGLDGPWILLDTDTSPSHLGLRNAATDGTLNIETTVGTGDITIDSNGDLHLKADLTIDARVSTTASFTSGATDNDMNFNVIANGAGTPIVKLENDTMAVQTICEANKKFTIEGGNGGDTFVFDVSSATGGITWPDGTEQITASSGGGGGLPQGMPDGATIWGTDLGMTSDAEKFNCNPGTIIDGTIGGAITTGYALVWPVIWPADGTYVDSIKLRVYSSASTDATASSIIGVYNSDDNGWPTTLETTFTIQPTSTGSHFLTYTLAADSSAGPFDRGAKVWLMFVPPRAVQAFGAYDDVRFYSPNNSSYLANALTIQGTGPNPGYDYGLLVLDTDATCYTGCPTDLSDFSTYDAVVSGTPSSANLAGGISLGTDTYIPAIQMGWRTTS